MSFAEWFPSSEIVATGIVTFVDDYIRRRWNLPASKTLVENLPVSVHDGHSLAPPLSSTQDSICEKSTPVSFAEWFPSSEIVEIVATGIVTFVDAYIRRRWNLPASKTFSHKGDHENTFAEPTNPATTKAERRVYNEPAASKAATFDCTFCPMKFIRSYDLRSHLRTHTDDRL